MCPSHNALCLQVSAANEASPPQWLPEDSEEICKVSTHINKPSYRGTLR